MTRSLADRWFPTHYEFEVLGGLGTTRRERRDIVSGGKRCACRISPSAGSHWTSGVSDAAADVTEDLRGSRRQRPARQALHACSDKPRVALTVARKLRAPREHTSGPGAAFSSSSCRLRP